MECEVWNVLSPQELVARLQWPVRVPISMTCPQSASLAEDAEQPCLGLPRGTDSDTQLACNRQTQYSATRMSTRRRLQACSALQNRRRTAPASW